MVKVAERLTGTRFISSVHPVVGKRLSYNAYVYDVSTGEAVASCEHRHGKHGRLGFQEAMACAERMAARAEGA